MFVYKNNSKKNSLKMIILINKSILNNEVANTRNTRTKCHKKLYAFSWKDKDLMKDNTSDEEKRIKQRPLLLANTSLTEKPKKTLQEYFELHIKILMLNVLME